MAYAFDPKNDIETQYQKWLDSGIVYKDVDLGVLTENVKTDLSFVSQMDVKEYTLYQKWCEVHEKYPTEEINTLFGTERQLIDPSQRAMIDEVKSNIWTPDSPDAYLDLEPVLIYTDDSGKKVSTGIDGSTVTQEVKRSDLPERWNTARTFISTMKNNSNIGRNLNFFAQDKKTGKYLGVVCISSDFLDLTPRDNVIGWERLSDTVQDLWKKQYGDTLVGVTTTSLYGKTKANGLSQYDNLDHWLPMGFTSGSVSFEPERNTRYEIREWLKKNHTRKYFEWYVAKKPSGQPYKRDHKNRSLSFTYSKLGIPKELIRSEHARGIYFSPLYDNTYDFLCGKCEGNDLKKSFETSTESLSNTWKEKHARGRIGFLKKKNKVSTETLFYDDLIYLTWQETKDKYLSQVGR